MSSYSVTRDALYIFYGATLVLVNDFILYVSFLFVFFAFGFVREFKEFKDDMREKKERKVKEKETIENPYLLSLEKENLQQVDVYLDAEIDDVSDIDINQSEKIRSLWKTYLFHHEIRWVYVESIFDLALCFILLAYLFFVLLFFHG